MTAENITEGKMIDAGIEILYEDAHVLVCCKPSGIPVQSSGMRIKDMVSILKVYRMETDANKGEPYIGVVHRLDQPVQGVVVFAKTKQAAADLSAQVSGGKAGKQAEKIYLAVVNGSADKKEAELVDYLLKDGKTNTSRVVSKDTKGAKESRLMYQVLEEKDGKALLEVKLFTGRHHQIRVQLAAAGMPIVGDQKYHPSSEKEMLALCAYSFSFKHPKTGKVMKFFRSPQGGAFDNFRQNMKNGMK